MYDYQSLQPDDLVFPFMKDIYTTHPWEYVFATYKNRLGDHNKYLKRMAHMAGIEGPITSYVARHSWASIGFQSSESLDLVGQGLGHSSDPKVTKVYAKDLDVQRIDTINATITKRTSKIVTKK